MDQDPSSTISPRLSPCLAPPHHRVDFLLLSLLFLDPLRFTLFFLSLCSFPPSSSLSPSLLLLLLILPYSRRSLRCIAPQQEQTSLRGRHGATESRWMDLSRSFLDPPELSRGPPREGSLGRKCVISGIRARCNHPYGRISRRVHAEST